MTEGTQWPMDPPKEPLSEAEKREQHHAQTRRLGWLLLLGAVVVAVVAFTMWNNAQQEEERRICELAYTLQGYDLVEAKILCD